MICDLWQTVSSLSGYENEVAAWCLDIIQTYQFAAWTLELMQQAALLSARYQKGWRDGVKQARRRTDWWSGTTRRDENTGICLARLGICGAADHTSCSPHNQHEVNSAKEGARLADQLPGYLLTD